MPHTHTRTFRVRHYECDAFGHLNNANYLRYMQETAFDASADAGYDPDRYAELGTFWLVRETDIEYHKPVKFNDVVQVKTWISDIQRVRSRRAYELSLIETGQIVAKATTDWVYLYEDSGKPATIPLEIRDAFFPEGLPDSFPPRERFPTAPPAPPGKFEMSLRVKWQDLDVVQHVNNAVYLNYVEECGMQVIAAHDWPISRMLSNRHAILVRRNQIQYRQPAKINDELVLTTWVSNVRRSTVTRHYSIKRKSDNAKIANVHAMGVFVNLDTGRPGRFPESLLKDFKPNMIL
jgi:acyl-CoA thioester hydrolase